MAVKVSAEIGKLLTFPSVKSWFSNWAISEFIVLSGPIIDTMVDSKMSML
jgi:hypothetical protein